MSPQNHGRSKETAPPPTERRDLHSDGSPTEPLPPGTARLHTPPPPPAPDKPSGQLSAPSGDEGSPILLLDPGDMVFQEIAAGGRQRLTPLRDSVITMAENSPPETALADDGDDILSKPSA